MATQQLLTQCQILQNKVFSGPKSSDEPTNEVPKRPNHGKNVS